jgi:predicted nucleic acid-binding Zn ribbon protein
MTRRPAPRPASTAFQAALRRVAPKTRLAAVQSVWAEVVGERLAGVAQPVSERDAVVTVACVDTVWTEELDLMGAQLEHALRERLGEAAPKSLRFRVKADAT